MKAYAVTVNGVTYNVTVEELNPGAVQMPVQIPVQAPVMQAVSAPAAQAAPNPSPSPASQPVQAAPAQSSASSSDTPVECPLPGTLIDFKVKVGDTVKQNDLVAIVEAMKMENEVVATCAGKVTSLVASKGSILNAGDVILTIAQ